MPFYIKNSKILKNNIIRKSNIIDKRVIPTHVNISTTNRLFGKNYSTDMSIYSYQDPYFNGLGKFTRNPSCWINGIKNISCASPAQLGGGNYWNRSGTLITPKHMLLAKHYPIGIGVNGTPILFVDENNNVIRRNLMNSIAPDDSDLLIGVLDSDVPSNIKCAKILPKNFLSYFLSDRSAIIPGQSINFNIPLYAVGFNQASKALLKIISIISVSNNDYGNGLISIFTTNLRDYGSNMDYTTTDVVYNALNPHPRNFTNFFTQIIAGDSGKPAFLIIDDEFVILSAWTNPSSGPFVTERSDIINNVIEQLSPNQGYSLTSIDLDAVYTKYSN